MHRCPDCGAACDCLPGDVVVYTCIHGCADDADIVLQPYDTPDPMVVKEDES